MDDPTRQVLYLLLALLLIALTGFFVAAEFSLVKIRSTRIDELAESGVFGAKKAREALKNLDGYLYATKLGVMLATLALGKVGDPALEGLLHPAFGAIQSEPLRQLLLTSAALLIVATLEFMLGELIPTTLALQSAEKILLATIYPLSWFYALVRMPVAGMKKFVGVLLRPFGILSGGHGDEAAHSEAEIRRIVVQSAAGGTIDEGEVDLVHKVFDFSDRTAREVMVPRPDVSFLSAEMPLSECVVRAEKAGFSRYPVMEGGSPDKILGLVHVKDLLRATTYRKDAETVSLKDAVKIRLAVSVPETKPVDALLRELQRQRQRLAIVADEYGGTAGIVTLEDIVEELVGDLQDEFDRSAPELEPAGKDCWTVSGGMSLDKLIRTLDFTGPGEEPDVDTVGGWIMVSLDEVPRTGDSVPFGDALFTVTHVAGRRVRRVRVCLPEPKPQEPIGADPSSLQS